MDTSPLVKDRVDAAVRFLHEFQKYMPIQFAAWVKEADASDWYLYVASDQITDENFDVAYGEVVPFGVALRDPCFDMFQVKLIGMDNALARAVIKLPQRSAGWDPAGRDGVWRPGGRAGAFVPDADPGPGVSQGSGDARGFFLSRTQLVRG